MSVSGHTESLRLLPAHLWTQRDSPSFYVFTCRKVASGTKIFLF